MNNLINSFFIEDEYNKFETVLTIDVHTRDMVDILIRDGITEVHDLWVNGIAFKIIH